jgi:hypothetical protein
MLGASIASQSLDSGFSLSREERLFVVGNIEYGGHQLDG